MKILNLYACLGGNRYKWGNDHEITAVELDPVLCELYKERFQNDTVICTDAHKYLLNHFQEFDFIWSSPPCPSHSRARFWASKGGLNKPIYPNMKLYQEIILLQNYYNGLFCVENVIPFYEPLVPGKKRGRHLYWTNFNLPNDLNERKSSIMEGKDEVKQWCKFHDFNFYEYKGTQRVDKIARNLVDFEAGLTIFNTARGIINRSNVKSPSLFDGVF